MRARFAVTAIDRADISAKTDLKAKAEIKNDFGASIIVDLANKGIKDYEFTTRSGAQTIDYGDRVYIDHDIGTSGPRQGELWIWTGADDHQTDFDAETYGSGWKKFIVGDILDWVNDNVVPSLGGGDAMGFGGMAVRNDIDSGANAAIKDSTVTTDGVKTSLSSTAGDILVSAAQTGTINADVKARVEATGSAKGKSIAINGIISTNNVLGFATATVDDSNLTANALGTGLASGKNSNVSVLAQSTQAITAKIDADTIAKQAAAGITLAFNTIGLQGQNFLFNTVDALLGVDVSSSIYTRNTNAKVVATVNDSDIDISGDLTVSATASQTIKSEISNFAKTMRGGASGAVSVGAVVALNRVFIGVEASITNSLDIDVDGAVKVAALNFSDIDSNVVSPVIAINYTYGDNPDAKSVSIALVVSRNAIDASVTAKIDNVKGTLPAEGMDAGSVAVSAEQKSTIDAVAAAAAVSVAAGTGGGVGVGAAGVVSFNTIVGGVSATIVDSDVAAPTGAIA